MAGISIRNLTKAFGALTVLKNIDLEVAPGGFTVLLGPSGCGKSTLLSAIAGLDEIDSGRIEIGNVDVTALEPSRRGIAMVFQSYALYPTMSVRRNMSFGLRVKRMAKPEIERRVSWAADMLQIRPLLDRKPVQLSGGQRQRVAIGRALVQDARVFLFDEPLSNLDAKLRGETRIEIKRLHQELNPTIVYVTHDQVEAMTLATRVAVMRAGVIEQYAPPDELYERPETLFVAGFVGSPAMNFLPAELLGGAARRGALTLPVSGYNFRAPVSDGSKIVVGLRPENIAIADDRNTGTVVDASLQFLEPMGADTLAWFDVDGARISARLPPHRARDLPTNVRLSLDMTHASLFDQQTERRL
jgi:multiple sugar transport system ATP-binding protein